VFIAHNLAAWVVREVLVQSQYDRELEKVPIGIVDFGLPHDLDREYWKNEVHWVELRDSLLAYFHKGTGVLTPKMKTKAAVERDRPSKTDDSTLTASTIEAVMQEFTTFREGLRSPDQALPVHSICCPEIKASYS
jgi:hypothetical protein